jgi:hypothetical protein
MKVICKYCNGNGYRRIWEDQSEKNKVTIQCSVCESEGEIETDEKKDQRLIKKIKDLPLAWMESIGSKMNVYAWGKRWGDRKKGTGYKNDK